MYFFTFIYIANRVVSGEIYTAGKNFTLPPGVTGVTNSTSAHSMSNMVLRDASASKKDIKRPFFPPCRN